MTRWWKNLIRRVSGRHARLITVGVALISLLAAGFLIQSVVGSSSREDTGSDASSTSAPEPSESASPLAEATPSPSPSPSPKQTPGLPPRPALPSPEDFPTPQNTGWRHTGVTLKAAVTEPYYATKAGQVLDSMDFQGGLWIRADNVTIKRSRVQCGGGPCLGLWVTDRKNVLIEDVEITSKSKDLRIDRALTGYGSVNLTIRRVYVHDTQRGIAFGKGTLIEDSYIDDQYNPTEAHVSAIGGDTTKDMQLTVRHNWIAGKPLNNNSAALLYYPPQVNYHPTPNLKIVFERNIINGGSYSMWLSSDPHFTGTLTVRSNLFGTKYFENCGQYGTHFTEKLTKGEGNLKVTWDNNVWHSPGTAKHGQQIPFQTN